MEVCNLETGTAYSLVEQVYNIRDPLECEQIIDIVLGEHQDNYSGNKHVDFINITRDWDAPEWKETLKEYYASYKKARLPELTFLECDNDTVSRDIAITSQRDLARYKKAPEPYYLNMACWSFNPPKTTSASADLHEILIACYVGLLMGENYPTIGYPSKKFIDEMTGIEITREQWYTTLLSLFEQRESFERIVCEEAEKDKKLVTQMKKSYKKLMEIDLKTTGKKIAGKAAAATAVVATAAVATAKSVNAAAEKDEERKKADELQRARINMMMYGPRPAQELHQRPSINSFKGGLKFFLQFYKIIVFVICALAVPLAAKVAGAEMSQIGFWHFIQRAWIFIKSLIPLLGCMSVIVSVVLPFLPVPVVRRFGFLFTLISVLCCAYSGLFLLTSGVSAATAAISGGVSYSAIADGNKSGIVEGLKGFASQAAQNIQNAFSKIGESIKGIFS